MEENKILARRYYEEAFGQGHIEVLDEVLADDYILHIPGFAGFLPSGQDPASGRAAEAERIREFRTDFAEVRITIEEMVAEGDRVATRVTIAGTQARPLGVWGSPDTGRNMVRESFAFYRVACGTIAEGWVLPDNLTMLRQLGIITDEELADAGTPKVATPAP
jgi:predicted ester cyclase